MVAGNVIGASGDLVDELPIITKFKELFHDKVVSEIVWSGENGPDVQSDPNVAAAFGAPLELTGPKVLNLGTRSNVEFIAVAGGGGAAETDPICRYEGYISPRGTHGCHPLENKVLAQPCHHTSDHTSEQNSGWYLILHVARATSRAKQT